MEKSKQKLINNNNRKRGGAFEKRGADFLDMDVVPYSGSNARFGYGDVRDSIWLGEFKNITPTDGKITIKMDWLTKNAQRSKDIDHLSFLAWMPAGSPDKFIIIDLPTFKKFSVVADEYEILENKVYNVRNLIFHLDANYIKNIRKDHVVEFLSNDIPWYMMSMAHFKDLINRSGLKGVRSGI